MADTPGTTDLQRLIAELRERLRPEAAPRPTAAEPPPVARPLSVATGERPMSDSDALELESVQRGQVLDALLHGTSPAPSARTGRGLWAGVAVAVAIALCVGLAAMVQATMAHGAH